MTRRTLHYYWWATRRHLGFFVGLMVSTFTYIALLSYANPFVMSLIVDRVSESPVAAEEVFAVFAPFVVALLLVNVVGQAASKLQDYMLYKLEISVSYDLATLSFDTLCQQSVSFHSNRYGGTLVSQTSKFMSAYNQLIETLNWPFVAVFTSIVSTCVVLVPRVPWYMAILAVLLVVYAAVSYYLYKRILSLNEKAAGAQNQLSGELSDSVANILAVKTYGREDYERSLFDAANKEVVFRDSKRMWASLTRGIITAVITVVIMAVVAVFLAGGGSKLGGLRQAISAALEMDNALYCKIERGDRIAKRKQVVKLAKLFEVDSDTLLSLWLADKLIVTIGNEDELAQKALNIVQEQIKRK